MLLPCFKHLAMRWEPRMIRRRVFVSMVADRILSKAQNDFKWAVAEHIEQLGYQVEIFYNARKTEGIAARKSWTPVEAEDVMRQCVGGVIIGHPRWRFRNGKSEVLVPTEYSQYEGAILKTLSIPLMVLAQENLFQRGVYEYNFGQFICRFPEGADREWIKSPEFQQTLRIWLADMADRRDLFMGYCSSSAPTAEKIKVYIEGELGASVLDWRADFSVGRTVLEEIAEAGKRCSAGIFLFTRDDVLSDRPARRLPSRSRKQVAEAKSAIPRDNVVFEAGYFIGIKGKRRVLIVREEGAKMPADLGGDIYAALEDRHDIEPIKTTLKKFVLGL
jgi:hypothetical protein